MMRAAVVFFAIISDAGALPSDNLDENIAKLEQRLTVAEKSKHQHDDQKDANLLVDVPHFHVPHVHVPHAHLPHVHVPHVHVPHVHVPQHVHIPVDDPACKAKCLAMGTGMCTA